MEELIYDPSPMTVENIEIKNGKYLVKFPFLDVPVEVSKSYYNSYFQDS